VLHSGTNRELPHNSSHFLMTVGRPNSLMRLNYVAKRGFDAIVASAILVFTLPLMILITAVVALDGGSIFYLSIRIGARGEPFKCIKFRTMIPDADQCLDEYFYYHASARDDWLRDTKLGFDPRITPIGAMLRRSGLDELPQLINVIRGEMSLVGPRAVTVSKLENYGSDVGLDNYIRPGVTGLWKVNGSDDVSAQVTFDEQYMHNWSVIRDLRVLFQTVCTTSTKRAAR
jgi:exopolysaccharide production protein ExoY